jgi:hypothetical protein
MVLVTYTPAAELDPLSYRLWLDLGTIRRGPGIEVASAARALTG